MNNTIEKNHQKYLERIDMFKIFGYDIEEERSLIFEQAQPIKGSILEVGTGKGHFAIVLAQKGYSFTSVDSSQEEQEYAKLNLRYFNVLNQVDLRVMRAEELSFDDESFDIIFAINMLHHLDQPYLVMHDLIRALKVSGKLIVSDFSKKGMDVVDEIHRNEGRKHSESKASINQVADYLTERGFRIEKHRTIFQETIVAYKLEGEEL